MKTRAFYLRLLIVLLVLLPISCKEVDQNSSASPSSGQPGGDSGERPPTTDQNEAGAEETSVPDYLPVDSLVQSPCGLAQDSLQPIVQFISDLTGEIYENRVEGILRDPLHDCVVSDLSEMVDAQSWQTRFTFLSDLAGLGLSMIMSAATPPEQETIWLYWQFGCLGDEEGCQVSEFPMARLDFIGEGARYFSWVVSGKVTVTYLTMDPKEGEQFEVSGKFEFDFPEGHITGTFFGTSPYYAHVP